MIKKNKRKAIVIIVIIVVVFIIGILFFSPIVFSTAGVTPCKKIENYNKQVSVYMDGPTHDGTKQNALYIFSTKDIRLTSYTYLEDETKEKPVVVEKIAPFLHRITMEAASAKAYRIATAGQDYVFEYKAN